MKLVKNLVATAMVLFAVSVTAFAGDQQTPGFTQPPPSSTMSCTPQEEPKNTVNPNTSAQQPDITDTIWIEALNALLSVY